MIKDVLRAQLELCSYSIEKNLDGVTHADSLVAPEGGGNCLNWVLGHIMVTRDAALRLMGAEPMTDERARELYARGSTPIHEASDALSLEDLTLGLDRGLGALLAALERAPDDFLAARVPALFRKGDQEPRIEQLGKFVFHECYHAGQLGVLRRTAGKVGAIQ